MKFSIVDSRPISLALAANGQWLNWAKSINTPVWESAWKAEDHLLACTPGTPFETFQQAIVPGNAVCQADCLLTFAGGVPINAPIATAGNEYLGPFPGGGVSR